MKIDDKEIDKLLYGFQGDDIDIPSELDLKLNNKLEEIKPKGNKNKIIAVVASILLLSISYTTIPSFKSFANQIFSYLFSDIGIENAINNGYEVIESQDINIGSYNMTIENIYIDNLRLGFDIKINNSEKINEQTSLDLGVNHESFDGGVSMEYAWFTNDNNYKSNVSVMGDGITNLYNQKPDKIELILELWENGDKLIGTSNVTFNIPKEVYDNKTVDINKNINDDKLNLTIKKLEISPTMMYLITSGICDGNDVSGLYNFKVVSDQGNIFKDNLGISGLGGANEFKQTIVPSMYYDKSKKFKLKADGVLVFCNEELEIKLDDTYPKKEKYFGNELIIKEVIYKNGNLEVKMIENENIDHLSSGMLDGKECSSSGVYQYDEESNSRVYTHFFENIEEKNVYKFRPNLIMKYKIPIEIDLKYNN
ncbi:hypothetical protein EAI30_07480 [Romboutsia ilealis]|uniref:DUF4179 domain-containing protein n=1 Tax=Romboutsia faecis TaxID=2764597 RepID=A0ABR7JL23_9FIRM|nr:DUF5643 domain-containing protein [Romboutsia faecis]MBC5995301.1 DUF4179 domain-containing protein [Romboutsia faecis]MRN24454.1 hypothetical protein [Romboutsia ilealis]